MPLLLENRATAGGALLLPRLSAAGEVHGGLRRNGLPGRWALVRNARQRVESASQSESSERAGVAVRGSWAAPLWEKLRCVTEEPQPP